MKASPQLLLCGVAQDEITTQGVVYQVAQQGLNWVVGRI